MRADDYPMAAIRRNEAGTVTTDLAVSAEGQVAACTVVESSGSSDLDVTTCRVLTQRARFNPARDRSGAAITGHYTKRVRWVLPSAGVPRVLPIAADATGVDGVVARTHISATGVMDECWVVRIFEGASGGMVASADRDAVCAYVRQVWARQAGASWAGRARWIEWRNVQFSYPEPPNWGTPPEGSMSPAPDH